MGRRRHAHSHPDKFLSANASPLPETHFGPAQTWHCRPSEKEEAKYLALSAVPGSHLLSDHQAKLLLCQGRKGQMLQAEALLEKCENCRQTLASVALTGRAALGPEDVFSWSESDYAFLPRTPQQKCAHPTTCIPRTGKWGQSRTSLVGGCQQGTWRWQWWSNHSLRPRGRALWFWGFSQSFPIEFLETRGWDINSAFVSLCEGDSLASPWAGLEGKREKNATGDSTSASVFGDWCVWTLRVL